VLVSWLRHGQRLPGAEIAMLTSAVPLSRAEQDLLVSWQDPPAWDSSTGHIPTLGWALWSA